MYDGINTLQVLSDHRVPLVFVVRWVRRDTPEPQDLLEFKGYLEPREPVASLELQVQLVILDCLVRPVRWVLPDLPEVEVSVELLGDLVLLASQDVRVVLAWKEREDSLVMQEYLVVLV